MTTTNERQGNPRMIDVARSAHVSTQTVSRYFNDGYVGTDARARIEAAVETLGYRFNLAARQLRNGSSKSIGALALGPEDFGVWSGLAGISNAARAAGINVIIGPMHILSSEAEFHAALRSGLEALKAAGVDGVIIDSPYGGLEEEVIGTLGDTPVVFLSNGPINSVWIDSYDSARLATGHLVDLGHQRILHLGGDPATVVAGERERGYLDAMAGAGLSALSIPHTDWTSAAAHRIGAMIDLDSFTAVVAASDALASGFMSALRDRGRTAPDDYSIVGIDGMPESEFLAPPLTTVKHDLREVGLAAFEMVTERIKSRADLPRRLIDPVMQVRRSTRRLD